MSPSPIRPGSPPTTSAAGAAENPDPSTLPPVAGVQNVFPVPETQDHSGGAAGDGAAGGPVVAAMVATNWPKPPELPRVSKEIAELEKAFAKYEEVNSPTEALAKMRRYRLFGFPIPSWLQAKIDSALQLFEERFGVVSAMTNFSAYHQRWRELQEKPEEMRETILNFLQRAGDLTRTEVKEFVYCFFQGAWKSLSCSEVESAFLLIDSHQLGPEMCFEFCVFEHNPLCGNGRDAFTQYSFEDLEQMYTGLHPHTQTEFG